MKLKIGLFGIGYFGMNYVRLLHNHPDAELVAICDANPKAFEKLKEQYPNAEYVTELKNVELDAIIICTPLSTHYDLAKMSLGLGKHTLVEKPMTDTVAKSIELISLAKEKNVKLVCGHTFIYNSLVRRVKKYIDDGSLGKILYMTFHRTGKSPIRDDCNSLADLSTHDISMALYWLEEMPKIVLSFGKSYLQTEIEDVCFTTLEFSNNIVAHLHSSWYEPRKQRCVTIVGSEKMLVFDDVAKTLVIYDGNYQYVQNIEYKEPLSEQVNDFIDSIINNRNPLVTGNDGLQVVKVLEAAQRSLKNNSEKVYL